MRVERNRDTARDIAYVLHALDITGEIWCVKYGGNCYKCPLGKLGVFEAPTCQEISKLKSRLELVYKAVETL